MPRRFQFSLRGLLILVLVSSGVLAWIGHQASIVRQRRAVLGVHYKRDGWKFYRDDGWAVEKPNIPWIRRKLGDEPIPVIWYFPKKDYEGIGLEWVRKLFPEAQILDASGLD